jgi:hypothetical protein
MLAIDFTGHSTQVPLEFLIFFDILTAWDGDLDEDNLVLQLRVIIEECVEALELLGQTFDVVQSVNADNDFYALIPLLEALDTVLNLGLLKSVGEFLRIYTNNELICANETVLVLNLIWNLSACVASRV